MHQSPYRAADFRQISFGQKEPEKHDALLGDLDRRRSRLSRPRDGRLGRGRESFDGVQHPAQAAILARRGRRGRQGEDRQRVRQETNCHG